VSVCFSINHVNELYRYGNQDIAGHVPSLCSRTRRSCGTYTSDRGGDPCRDGRGLIKRLLVEGDGAVPAMRFLTGESSGGALGERFFKPAGAASCLLLAEVVPSWMDCVEEASAGSTGDIRALGSPREVSFKWSARLAVNGGEVCPFEVIHPSQNARIGPLASSDVMPHTAASRTKASSPRSFRDPYGFGA
jgi:hypothetical protein